MSDEEQNQNADAGEKEILEQAQGAAAEEQEAVSSLEEELLKWRDSPCAPQRNTTTTASAW